MCCLFRDVPIRFRTTTAAACLRSSDEARLLKRSQLCLANAQALGAAVEWCAAHGVGAFRVVSQILPLKTHPQCGYTIDELPDAPAIAAALQTVGAAARRLDVRLSFHPDQFVVLNSPRPEVVAASRAELLYQAEVAAWIGADVVNIHAGGAYGDKRAALVALHRALDDLPDVVRTRLTLENDDVTFTPADLLPLCRAAGIPLTYDVHHHRCLPDGLVIDEATSAAQATWNREPLFHISSPLEGWSGRKPTRHHDYIDSADFPAAWRAMRITVDVEAKAKEAAVLKLAADLAAMRRASSTE